MGPRIRWPFFNYGRIKNSVRVEDARFQQLLVGYRNTVLKAAQEVEDALAGFLNAQEAVVFEERSVKAAQRSVEIALVQYREGAVDYQRVLDAQRSLLQQQNSLAQTRSSVATNLIALYKALGGGWESRQGQPVVPEPTQDEMKKRTNWGDMLSEPSAAETKKSPSPRSTRESTMSKMISKKALKWLLVVLGVAVVALIGFRYWKARQTALPEGIASGNGRLEAKLVDVAAKEPLRVKEVLVDEGALVKPGQVLVRLDTVTLEAELAEANEGIAAAEERLAFSKASIVKQKSEIELAEIELERSRRLVKEGAGSQREFDVRKTQLETTKATLAEAEAMLQTAKQQVEVARANAATIQTRIDDATLKSPVHRKSPLSPGRSSARSSLPAERR